jgi:glycosyltransferase involved in cell wall biosynthesis
MASGLPVIATRVGGNPELVVEGRTGILVPTGDVDAMAQAIVAHAMNPEQASTSGKTGRNEIEQRFSMEAMVGAYQGLYDRLLFRSHHHNR